VVGARFQVKHLLDGVPEPRFAVLALSRKTSRLFTGDATHFDEVERAGLPMAMDEVLRYDDREPQLQSHGSARRGGGTVVASFHGQGGRREQGEDLLRYLRAVSTAVETVLTDECLIPAGTEELVAAFRRMTSYAHVAAGEIAGSGERLSAVELAAGARPLIEEAVTAPRTAALARLVEVSGTDAAALDLGIPLPHLTGKPQGKAPDAGALELGDELLGEKSKFPTIPQWLLDEWPLARRGQ
jgi:hypothetical protein